MSEEKIVVVTTRCIDMACPTPDSEKRACSECGEITWLSSSWKGKRIDEIICELCFFKSEEYKKDDYTANVTEKCLEDAIQYIREYYNLTCTDEEIRERMIKSVENKIGKKILMIK